MISDDVDFDKQAALTSNADAARFLQEHLGQRLTAYICGLKDAKTVGRWASGQVSPREGASLRLRLAFSAALGLVAAYGSETARSWFVGTNATLGDSPAWLLRHGRDLDDLRMLVPVAREFASAGIEQRRQSPRSRLRGGGRAGDARTGAAEKARSRR